MLLRVASLVSLSGTIVSLAEIAAYNKRYSKTSSTGKK